ncbi:unnamed protein product, partial [Symbiodinium microadriaticum]
LWENETDLQWEKSKESSEKFVFMKLYDALFATNILDAEKDAALHDRVKSLAFLSPEHLDMKSFQLEWSLRFSASSSLQPAGAGADKEDNRPRRRSGEDCPAWGGGKAGGVSGQGSDQDARVREALEDLRGVDAAVNALHSLNNARCPADK